MKRFDSMPREAVEGWPWQDVAHPAGEHVPFHYHDIEELLEVMLGALRFVTPGGREFPVTRGQALRIPPGEVHRVDIGPEGASYHMWKPHEERDGAFPHRVSDELLTLLRDNLALPDVENRWERRNRAQLSQKDRDDELHRLARQYLRRERPGHSLQTTALVNETYLRLTDYTRMKWKGREHFLAVSAQVMRRILVDHARRRRQGKRGGGVTRVPLDEAESLAPDRPPDLTALDEALQRLAGVDERKSRVVELRFFGGLSVEETAAALNVSAPTVLREWSTAKAWLYRELNQRTTDDGA